MATIAFTPETLKYYALTAILHSTNVSLERDLQTKKKTAEIGLGILQKEIEKFQVEHKQVTLSQIAGIRSLIHELPDDEVTIEEDQARFTFLSHIAIPSFADFVKYPPQDSCLASSFRDVYLSLLSSWIGLLKDSDQQIELYTKNYHIMNELEKNIS